MSILFVNDLDPDFAKMIGPIKDQVIIRVGNQGGLRSISVTDKRTLREIARESSLIADQREAFRICSIQLTQNKKLGEYIAKTRN